ncbi:hypothetical protein GGP41_004783 [Bipolaris sorokiniana]|uniref:Uncharacterized protein n=1 Tax=Cochliobolus sativus TaxID=45130 RepID=A0A8H5ZEI4_COCSA|nr:hypothetical protein GGP41_004783 [Bipolaris sorokiniana]
MSSPSPRHFDIAASFQPLHLIYPLQPLYSNYSLAYPHSPPEHPTHSLDTCCMATPMTPTSRIAFSSYHHTSRIQSPLDAPLP